MEQQKIDVQVLNGVMVRLRYKHKEAEEHLISKFSLVIIGSVIAVSLCNNLPLMG